MRLRKAPVLAAALALGTPAGAEDSTGGTKWIEYPSHRALADLRAGDPALAPFETDGCSGGLSTVWTLVADSFPAFAEAHGLRAPWEACCVAHDRLYHDAGPDPDPAASYRARLDADRALRACVLETGARRVPEIAARYEVGEERVREAYAIIARAMFLAVRFGGAPCSGLPWRWGYGYPHCVVSPGDVAGDR